MAVSTEVYSRLGTVSLIKEVTPFVPLTPTTFVPVMDEKISMKYSIKPSMVVEGLRMKNINSVKDKISSGTGTLSLNVEPKTFGHFMKGMGAAGVDGTYMQFGRRLLSGVVTGTPAVGATLLQATSGAIATVWAIGTTSTYFDVKSITGSFDASHVVTGTNPDSTTFTFTPTQVLNGIALQVGETITGGTSAATAVISFVDENAGVLLLSAVSGPFTLTEKITGSIGGGIATMIIMATTVFGHAIVMPAGIAATFPTYTVQINYVNNAIRYFGLRFTGLDFKQKDNIITCDVKVMAQGQFRHGRVTAITGTGMGTKTITVDQTLGLVAGDTIKLWSPSTSTFKDFSAGSVKTHTVLAVLDPLNFTVTNLQTATAVGDLIELAPQTSSFTTGAEFVWIGGAAAKAGTDVANYDLIAQPFEDYSAKFDNMYEERHAALGLNLENRLPSAILAKGFTADITSKAFYQNENFMALSRQNIPQGVQLTMQGTLIASTGIPNLLIFEIPKGQIEPFDTNLANDAIIDQALTFTAYYDSTTATGARMYLINDVATY